jgi:hypothetical protein
LTHVDDPSDRKTRGSDANEHTGSQILARKLLRHEAVDEGCVDHERDQKANSLEHPPSNDNLQGTNAGNMRRENTSVWTYDQQRVCGKDPNWSHLGDCECLCGPTSEQFSYMAGLSELDVEWSLQHEVDATAKEKCHGAVDPEQDVHGVQKPWASFAVCGSILGNVDQDGSEADKPCRHEEALRRMGDRCSKSRRIEAKSQRYHGDVEDEQADVEKKEGAANGIEARKPVRDCKM